jgi:hypothetical protein
MRTAVVGGGSAASFSLLECWVGGFGNNLVIRGVRIPEEYKV